MKARTALAALILSLNGGADGHGEALAAVGDDHFVATCLDMTADEIEMVSLCIVGLDGSIKQVADGLTPGRQVALSGDRRLIAATTADEVLIVDPAGESVASIPVEFAAGLAWMPDGESLLVQEITDGAWSIVEYTFSASESSREIASGEAPKDAVRRGIALTPDGNWVLQASGHGDEFMLDAIDVEGSRTDTWYTSREMISVPDVSPNGEWFAAAVGARIEVVEIESGDVVHVVEQPNPVTTPSFSPDGSQLMYVEARGAVEYQDVGDEASDRVIVDITRGDDPSAFPANATWS